MQISAKSHEVKYHRSLRGSFAWQSAKQPRSSNHLTRLTENGTAASVLELLPAISSLSRLKEEKKIRPERFSVSINSRIMSDCFATRTRMRLLCCTSSRLSASGYSKRNRFCMQNSLIVGIT